MLTNITLKELAEFTRDETKLLADLGLAKEKNSRENIPQHLVNNILNYSKALSTRKSKLVGVIETMLN